jgi:hypothetical protein
MIALKPKVELKGKNPRVNILVEISTEPERLLNLAYLLIV